MEYSQARVSTCSRLFNSSVHTRLQVGCCGQRNAGPKKSRPMTTKDAARIQSNEAKSSGGKVQSGSFASRAQSAAAKNSRGSKQTGR